MKTQLSRLGSVGAAAVVTLAVGAFLRSRQAQATMGSAIAQKAMAMSQTANAAKDPSLPAVVATVDGTQIPATEVEAMEGSLEEQGLGVVGTDSTRQAALKSIIVHIAVDEAALRAGFVPSTSLAEQEAQSAGMPTTAQVIAAYQQNQLEADLEHKVMAGLSIQAGANAWNMYVNNLFSHTSVATTVPWWHD